MSKFDSFYASIFLVLFFSCNPYQSTPMDNSVVSTAHPLATQAGQQMYAQGGNAFDAAVAAGFALAVVEPSMSGLGGRLQAIYKTSEGKISGVDASTEVPINYVPSDERNSYGYPTIGIPGVVAGLIAVHEKKGKLPLKTILQPAIDYAKNGFRLLPGEALRQQNANLKLREFEGSRYHFLKQDSLSYTSQDTLVQKDLAVVLEAIAQNGRKGFYEGEIAQNMVNDLQANGGILTLEDLRNYQARESSVLSGKFRGHDVYSLYLPSFGAITLQILQILDHLNNPSNEDQWAYQTGKAVQLAYTFRKHQTNDSILTQILSYDKASEWAKQLDLLPIQKDPMNEKTPISWTSVQGHTTHLTTADQWGNVVSLTQTIGPNMGSKVATKGLGFLYAVTLGGYLGDYKPGDRANSHISPTLVEKNNQIVLALGAAGGSRIVPAVTQVIDRYINQNHQLDEALTLPRVYPYQDSLWVENHAGLKGNNAQFKSTKFPIKYIEEPARFGRVHAIAKKNNLWIGAADPDWEGTAAYFPKYEE